MCYKFHGSNDFEAMKAGKLAIWPWLSCPYNKHRLVDLQSSMLASSKLSHVLFSGSPEF